jgi:hypothetical protein
MRITLASYVSLAEMLIMSSDADFSSICGRKNFIE